MTVRNSSAVSSFTLAAYLDLGPFRPLCFLLLLSLYATIVCSNVLLILSRFDMSGVPPMLRVFLSLYWLTCQPLFNPLTYGFSLSKVRILCRSLTFSR
ncbi:uncharacterized protein V6R79_024355 [Siganus canaliculatus]